MRPGRYHYTESWEYWVTVGVVLAAAAFFKLMVYLFGGML